MLLFDLLIFISMACTDAGIFCYGHQHRLWHLAGKLLSGQMLFQFCCWYSDYFMPHLHASCAGKRAHVHGARAIFIVALGLAHML